MIRKGVVEEYGLLRQLTTVVIYFVIGSVFYGVVEGWAPLDTCYFLLVCAVGTLSMPQTRLRLTRHVPARAGVLAARQDQHHGRVRRHLS